MIALRGVGLHGGRSATATLSAREGATTIRVGAQETQVIDARVIDTDRATTIAVGDARVRTVEHLFAALGATGAHAGVAIEVEGDELPLLDGGAAAYVAALELMGAPASESPLVVVRDGVVEVAGSRYAFARASERRVAVTIEFEDARLEPRAEWSGDARDFAARIAPARTFAFAREVEALAARGLASHVSPSSVVVIGEDQVHAFGARFTADEPARHKLLDLIGDLFLYGGPPRGSVEATRPGHRATHEAMREAIARGLLVRGY